MGYPQTAASDFDDFEESAGPAILDLDSAYSDNPDHPGPYKQQQQFHDNKARFRAFIGSVAAGKTCAGMHEAFFKCGEHPRTFGLVCSPTYPMLTKTVLVWMEQLHERWPGFACHYNKTERRLTFSNGSTIWFGYAAEPDSLRGPNLNWFWLDEAALVGEKTFHVLQGRIRRSGFQGGWITTTPQGRNWVWRKFIDTDDRNYWWVRARLEDNPGLSEDYVTSLRDSYTGAWAHQELDAEFVTFEGLVYDTFNPLLHIAEPPERSRIRRTWAGIDWGFSAPGAIAVMGECDDGSIWLLHEEYERRLSMVGAPGQDWLTICRTVQTDWRCEAWFGDPADPGAIRDLQTAGIPIYGADNSKIPGIRRVTALINTQRFRAATYCVRFAAEIAGYEWAKDRDGKPLENERTEKGDDHVLDAVRYAEAGRAMMAETEGDGETVYMQDIIPGFRAQRLGAARLVGR